MGPTCLVNSYLFQEWTMIDARLGIALVVMAAAHDRVFPEK
jgi:hypothetical protein